MRKHKQVEHKYTNNVLVELSCDLCGKVAKHANWGNYYETEETNITVSVEYKTGVAYPEGGSCKEYSLDICPDCFKTKLLPWFKEQGGKPILEDSDW